MMTALRHADQNLLAHVMVRKRATKSRRPELIERSREGSLVHARREHCQKIVRARDQVGNHLLTQVKDNQPGLRRKLELDRGTQAARRRKADGGAQSHETRLEVFDAKAWFAARHGAADQDVLRLTRIVHRRDAATDFGRRAARRFLVSSAQASRQSYGALDSRALRNRERQHHVRDTTFAEDASRIRKNPTSQRAYAPSPIICSRARKRKHQKSDGAPRSISTFCSISSPNIRTEQPWLVWR